MKITAASILDRLDLLAAVTGILIGAMVLLVFPSQRGLGAIIVIACIFYLFVGRRGSTAGVRPLELSGRQRQILNLAFWGLFAASVWIYATQPMFERPLAYFIIISLAAGVIATEALSLNEDEDGGQVYLILLQIFLLSLNITMGIFYEFSSVSGADAFAHAKQVQYIADNGFIAPYQISEKYAAYPVFHVTAAMTKILTSLSVKSSIFWSAGLYHVVSTVFLYYIGRKLAGPSIGLLSVLLFNISMAVINEGAINIIPATLVTGWFLLMLHLILNSRVGGKEYALLTLLTFIIVITHQLSTFVVLIVMVALLFTTWVARGLYGYSQQVLPSYTYVILFAVFLFSYWGGIFQYQEIGYNFFLRIVGNFITIFTVTDFGAAEHVDAGVQYSLSSNILFFLGFFILLIPGIGGTLRWLSYRDNRRFPMAVITLVLLAIIYGTSAFGLRTVIPGRWFPVLSIFLVIMAAEYMFALLNSLKPYPARVIIFIVTCLVSFFMITTPAVNQDHPLYALERAGRTHFKEAEVTGISTLNEFYSGVMRVDGYYSSGIVRQLDLNSKLISFDIDYVRGGGEEGGGTLTVVRGSIFEEPTTLGRPPGLPRVVKGYKLIIDRQLLERFQRPGYSAIYSNGEVTGYLAP